jgi:pilus assembly protein Flp/PilA
VRRHAPPGPVLEIDVGERPGKCGLDQSFLSDDSGATAIEYGPIAAGISVAIIAVVNTIGSTLNTNFSSISSQLK